MVRPAHRETHSKAMTGMFILQQVSSQAHQ